MGYNKIGYQIWLLGMKCYLSKYQWIEQRLATKPKLAIDQNIAHPINTLLVCQVSC